MAADGGCYDAGALRITAAPPCTLELTKSCEIVQPTGPEFTSCKGKLQQFSVIWPGPVPITISGITNDAPSGM